MQRVPRARAITLLLATVAWVLLGVACARYDLTISRAVVQPGVAWAAFGERFGSLPGAYVLALSATLAFLYEPRSAPRSRLGRAALWFIASAAAAMAVGASGYRFLGHRFSVAEGMVTMAVVASLLWAARRRVSATLQVPPRVVRAAHWATILGVSSWLVVHVAKLLWGRVRYRDLDDVASAFTPWYEPRGLTGHSSFPSGHTAMGWMLLPCLFLYPRGSLAWRVLAAFSVGWGIFVAASRVVIGAHYVSDVLFSTAFAATVSWYAFDVESTREARLSAQGVSADRSAKERSGAPGEVSR